MFPKFLQLRYADAIAHTLYIANDLYIDGLSKAKEYFIRVLSSKDTLTIKNLKINGYDLMNLGYQRKDIGIQLQTILNTVLDDLSLNDREKLLTICKK